MNKQLHTLDYAIPKTSDREIRWSLLFLACLVVCSAAGALIEYAPEVVPPAMLPQGDLCLIPPLLVWMFGLFYILQRAGEDPRWPCASLGLFAIAGVISCTLFAIQCVIWREQINYDDESDLLTIVPFIGALLAFGLAAVGRWRANRIKPNDDQTPS